jgi:hypothetical protein
MRHVEDAQAGFFSLMGDVEDPPAIGTLLDRQAFASVTAAIEIIVADENHVFSFSRLLGVTSRDKDGRDDRSKDDREKDSRRCSPRDESSQMIRTSTWSECWQTRRVSSSWGDSQELSSASCKVAVSRRQSLVWTTLVRATALRPRGAIRSAPVLWCSLPWAIRGRSFGGPSFL